MEWEVYLTLLHLAFTHIYTLFDFFPRPGSVRAAWQATMAMDQEIDEDEVEEYKQEMSQVIAQSFTSEDSGLEVAEEDIAVNGGKTWQ